MNFRTIDLKVPVPLNGLSLTVPSGWKLARRADTEAVQTGQIIVIRHARSELLLKFRKN